MFRIDASAIDKSLPVPVGMQLHGLLTYALSFEDLPYGTKLQSVRQLAAELNIAPMTVNQVYQQLRAAGLVEMRPGLGAFTARDPHRPQGEAARLSSLRSDIEAMLGKAESMGLTSLDLVSMINAQAQLHKPRAGLDIVFVGIFEGPTRDYVSQLSKVLAPSDTIRQVTIDMIEGSPEARAMCEAADLVLTFINREVKVKGIVPNANVMAIRLLPSQKTRQALAGLDPRTRVAAIAYFQDYVSVMRPSVAKFAPHVEDIRISWCAAADVRAVIEACDAVVYASGADHIADMVRPGVPCFEFRHAVDPTALEDVLVPSLSQLRRAKIVSNEPERPPTEGAARAG